MGREINNLKTTSTLVDGISADYASFQVDYPESVVDLRGDEVKMSALNVRVLSGQFR
jgi:hypothetical protein